MRVQGAAPEATLAGTPSDNGEIDKGQQEHNCIGCGAPTDDAEQICADCRHTDSKHGTLVTGPGRPCADCGAQ
jgi:hypothetical protein